MNKAEDENEEKEREQRERKCLRKGNGRYMNEWVNVEEFWGC